MYEAQIWWVSMSHKVISDLNHYIKKLDKDGLFVFIANANPVDFFREDAFVKFVNHHDWMQSMLNLRLEAAIAIVQRLNNLPKEKRELLLNKADDKGYTALHWATVVAKCANSDRYDVTQLRKILLDAGANPDAVAGKEKFTPDQFANFVKKGFKLDAPAKKQFPIARPRK